MNNQPVNLKRYDTRATDRAGMPLDVATFGVRLFEFLLVLGTGGLAVLAIDDALTVAEATLHLRVVFITAIEVLALARQHRHQLRPLQLPAARADDRLRRGPPGDAPR